MPHRRQVFSLQIITATKNWQMFYPLCNITRRSCATVWYTSKMAQWNHWWSYSSSFSLCPFHREDGVRWKGWESFLIFKSDFTARDSSKDTTIGSPQCWSLSLNHKVRPTAICEALPNPHSSGVTVLRADCRTGPAVRTKHSYLWECEEFTALLPTPLQGFTNIYKWMSAFCFTSEFVLIR